MKKTIVTISSIAVLLMAILGGCVPNEPAQFEVTSLVVNPNPVSVGEETTVTISIENVGERRGTYTVSLLVDGAVEQTKDITLAGGAMGAASFAVSKGSCGSYSVEAAGQKDILEVIQIERLSTGSYLVEELFGGPGELKIENGLDLDAVAILSSLGEPKAPLMAVYIQATHSYTISGIKAGTYVLYFTLGEDWDSCSERFTTKTTYERFEDDFDFTHYNYEVTLHPVVGGTAETEAVDEDEFPELG
jgi:hypothetical protein